jgi:uncharacterized membrane protein
MRIHRAIGELITAVLGRWPRRFRASFSSWGLLSGALFFAASLTPSLLPRHYAVQGILSGMALAAGYAVGVFFVWLWKYLELPAPGAKLEQASKWVTAAGVAIVMIRFLALAPEWQNSVRRLMEMEVVETAYPWRVGVIAVLIGVLIVIAARLTRLCWRLINGKLSAVIPRRVAYVLSTLLVGFVLLVIANKLVARSALHTADSIFLEIDKMVDPGLEPPADPDATGSSASLIAWDTIGIQGKRFLVSGPTQQSISQFRGTEALPPLRVYAGMRTNDSIQDRARLALEELKRVGGFSRSVLVVATPTGTGWLDPGAVDTVEYLHAGDTAIVSMQYSHLPSWITILVDPQRSRHAARALFDEIYSHWRTLPRDSRPKLYVHGLSLGSLGSEASADLFTVFEDPIHGGVWSGPPFPSPIWSSITRARNPDSPMWLPVYRDGSMVRFTGQTNALDRGGKRWGPMRFVYIQYASDPMCFFSTDLLYRKPDWLNDQRGPDVSPYLKWFPIVTFLQTGFDLPMATSVPLGYGHNYHPDHYLDAWIAVTDPAGWSDEDTRRLKQWGASQRSLVSADSKE